MTTHLSCRRVPALALAAALAALAAAPPPALAHLSLIRQGIESAGFTQVNDWFGWSVTAGDFNGDGYDDVAIGMPGETVGGLGNAGAVVVSYGSPTGITHVGSTMISASSLGLVSQAGAQFGFAVHAADINQDGNADLLIGAPFHDVDSFVDAGCFYFVFGLPGGLHTVGTEFNQDHVGAQGPEAGDQFGYSFATGNFDGDANGYLDLAVGSPGENGMGGVAVNFLGGPFGPTIDQTFLVMRSDVGAGYNTGDLFGRSLAAGNLLGTSHDDLAIGAPGEDVGPSLDAGRVWVLQGAGAGLASSPALSYTAANEDLSESNGRFGTALAAGHFFAGGYDGLAIGEPGRTVNALADAGRVVVAKGFLTGLDFVGDNGRVLTEDSGGMGIVQANDRFGTVLAAGEFWSADGFDDVAIGAPGDGLGFTANAGQFQIFPGGNAGPTGAGWSGFNQGTCNDPSETGDRFGASIAFGRFDNSDYGGFVVGAPNEDVGFGGLEIQDGGQVHVIAPWRQVFNLTSQTAMMGDCYGNPLFSLRPFDNVYIASTTKIMTVLLACEHIAAGLDPNTAYAIPLWVSADMFVDGSQCDPPLQVGETLTLLDLMYMCLRYSGNDAAFAIADIVYGGGGQSSYPAYVANVVAFVDEMNARAASLGMILSHFTNPPGYDWPHQWLPTGNDHRSTAWDMWLLGKAAMVNPLFAQVCGRMTYSTTRKGAPYDVQPGFAGRFADGRVIGLKDGGTKKARTTGVFAAKNWNGPGIVVGSLMGTPTNPAHFTEPMAMMNVALARCADPQLDTELLATRLAIPNISTRANTRKLVGSRFGPSDAAAGTSDDMTLDLHRQSGDQPTALHLEVGRFSEVVIDPGTSVPFGIAPFESHRGYQIANLDSFPQTIRLHLPGGVSSLYEIEPDSVLMIPPVDPGPTGQIPDYTISLENPGITAAYVSVQETYAYDLTNIPAADPDPVLRLTLRRAAMLTDGFWVETEGQDGGTVDEQMMFAWVHHGTGVLAVEDSPRPNSEGAELRMGAPWPNPSAGRTRIAFDLARSGSVGLSIHDLQGRAVRRIPERPMSAGRWDIEWDGLDADGHPVRSGLYFYRATLDGRPSASGAVVIAR